MKKPTKISWIDFTINWWEGCTKQSAGCANCYAELRNQRYSEGRHWGPGAPRKTTVTAPKELAAIARHFHPKTGDRMLVASEPRSGNRQIIPAKDAGRILAAEHLVRVRPQIFSLSLGDILDPEADPLLLAEACDAMAKFEWLEFLLVTKQPHRFDARMNAALQAAYEKRPEFSPGVLAMMNGLPNVAWGATVEHDATRYRIAQLFNIPAARWFLSVEPLIGRLEIPEADLKRLAMVFDGGESTSNARPSYPAWHHSIRADCRNAGTPYHFKQWGTWAPTEIVKPEAPRGTGNAVWMDWEGRLTDGEQPQPSDFHKLMVRTSRRYPAAPVIFGKIEQPRLIFP